MRLNKLFFAILCLLGVTISAQAQGQINPNTARVVTTCGTAPSFYPSANDPAPLTVDVNGNLCAGVSVSATVATTGLAISVAVGVSSTGVPVTPAGGVASTSAPSWSNGTIVPFSFETDGDLRVAASVTPSANQIVSTTKAQGSGAVAVVGAVSDGGTLLGGPVMVGGVSGTTVQLFEVNDQTPAGTEYGLITRNIPSGTQAVSGTVTVTDGAGALNVILDSGTLTTITNAVTVTDGAGSLNVIVDSGTVSVGGTVNVNFLTANIATNVAQIAGQTPVVISGTPVVTLTSTAGNIGIVTVTDGAGALNVICDSGCSATGNISQIGSVNVSGAGAGALAVMGVSSDGSAVVGSPVIVGGVSGSTVQQAEMNNQTPAGTEYGLIVRNIPSGTQTVSGSVTVSDGAGALNVIVDSGTITVGNTVNVNFLTATIPVSGTVTVSNAGNISQVGSVNVLNAGLGALSITGAGSSGATFAGAPVVIGGVSGTTIQSLNANNQTPAGTEYGLIVRNIPSGTQNTNVTQIGSTNVITVATLGVMPIAGAEVYTPTSANPGPGRTVGNTVQLVANTNGALSINQADCGDAGMVTSVSISTSGIGQTQLVALTTGQTIYVCGWNVFAAGTTSVNLSYGTGVQCGTGNTVLTGAYSFVAQTGIALTNAGAVQTKTAVSNALCVNNSAAQAIAGMLTYIKRTGS